MKKKLEYILGDGTLSFIAFIISGVFILMLENFSEGSEIYKFATSLIGVFTCLIWLYRFNRSWFFWLPRMMSVIAFFISNIIIFVCWYESYYSSELTLIAYETKGYISGADQSFFSIFGPLLILIFIVIPCVDNVFFNANHSVPLFGRGNQVKRRRFIRFVLLGPGFLMSLYVAVHNFSVEAIINTLNGASIVIILGAVVTCFIWFGSIKEKRLKILVQKDLKSIPTNIIKDIENYYQAILKNELMCSLHSVDSNIKPRKDAYLSSKIGGKPYAESIYDCPALRKQPSYFCMQLLLSSSNLPKVWLDRLITVYLVDWSIQVKSYDSPSMEKWVDTSRSNEQFEERHLITSEIPYKPIPDDDSNEDAWDDFFDINSAEYALRKSEDLQKLLTTYTKYPDRVLNSILIDSGVRTNDSIDIILEGGAPHYIQGEHEPVCKICNNPMRFLFEFGEVLEPEYTIGDAAMTYVFGCDFHPEHCAGFIDSH